MKVAPPLVGETTLALPSPLRGWTKSHFPIACGLYIKNDCRDILKDEYEYYCREDSQSGDTVDVVDWFIRRVSYYNKLLKEIFFINIPLKEHSITPLYSRCYYCNEYMDDDAVRYS